MSTPETDRRSADRKALDERIAAAAPLKPRDLPADAPVAPVEEHLARRHRRPIAVAGVVEHGVVRPMDPTVKLPEHARVIIVATNEA